VGLAGRDKPLPLPLLFFEGEERMYPFAQERLNTTGRGQYASTKGREGEIAIASVAVIACGASGIA